MFSRKIPFPLFARCATLLACVCVMTAAAPPVPDTHSKMGYGPNPTIVPPQSDLIPTVKIAAARGWRNGALPQPAAGLQVQAFATGLQHPRSLYVLPNGDVLVAETDSPEKPDDAKGLSGYAHKIVMKHAGSGIGSANRITLLRDTQQDGHADQRSVFAEGLNSPFGMALAADELYIADTDAVVHAPYANGEMQLKSAPRKLADLPAGTINHHWTKSLVASRDGGELYVGIGSNSNAGDNGIDAEAGRADVWKIDRKTGAHRVYASGTRNPTGLAWGPDGGPDGAKALWVIVNERDELGNDVPLDYLTALQDGGFYGFPYSYWGAHIDARVKPQRPDLVAQAIVPDYAVGPHTAPLGICNSDGSHLPAPFQHGMFISLHGSWNRNPRSGYKVIFVPFRGDTPDGLPVDVLSGFLDAHDDASGRPVGVAIAKDGSLLVADDVGGTVWRVSAAAK